MIPYIFSILLISTSHGMDQVQQQEVTLDTLLTNVKNLATQTWGLNVPNNFEEIFKTIRVFIQKYSYPNIIQSESTYQQFKTEIENCYRSLLTMNADKQATLQQESQFAYLSVALYSMSRSLHRRGMLNDVMQIKETDENAAQKKKRLNIIQKLYWRIVRPIKHHGLSWDLAFPSSLGSLDLVEGKQILSLPWLDDEKELMIAACQFLTPTDKQNQKNIKQINTVDDLETHLWKKRNAYYIKYGFAEDLWWNFFKSVDPNIETINKNKNTEEYWQKYMDKKMIDPLSEVQVEIDKLFNEKNYEHLKSQSLDLSHLYKTTTLKEKTAQSTFFRTQPLDGRYWNGYYSWKKKNNNQQQQQNQSYPTIYIIDNTDAEKIIDTENEELKKIQERRSKILGNSGHGLMVKSVINEYANQDSRLLEVTTTKDVHSQLEKIIQEMLQDQPVILSLSIGFPYLDSIKNLLKEFLNKKNTVLFWAVSNTSDSFSDMIHTNSTKQYIDGLLSYKDKIVLVGNVDCAYSGTLKFKDQKASVQLKSLRKSPCNCRCCKT